MSKVDINVVAAALKQCHVEPPKIREVIELINEELAAQDKGDEKQPAIKKQYAVLVSDPAGRLPDCDFVAWVLQLPEYESPDTVHERVHRAAYEFNATKRGRLLPAETVGDAIENTPAKHFKEVGLWVKTKTPVLVIKTDNVIPKDKVDISIRYNGEEWSTK